MMVRIVQTKRNFEFVLFRRWPVTSDTIEEAIEDGKSAWYASTFRLDPSYTDWRVEICEYDLDKKGEPVNIRIIGSGPIEN